MIRGFLDGTESWGSVSTANKKPTPLSQLKDTNVLNDQVGSVPVAVFHAVATDTTTVFCLRLINRSIGGKSKGQPSGRSSQSQFRFSWAGFYPNTEIHATSTGQPRRIGGLKLDRQESQPHNPLQGGSENGRPNECASKVSSPGESGRSRVLAQESGAHESRRWSCRLAGVDHAPGRHVVLCRRRFPFPGVAANVEHR
jgi:hypothetical protein